ncbi:MAG: UxaA family hydrolase [Desulfobacterales bacterium]|jgi:(2R)-sulfolactate sulfo-lyase subunit beta|nr:UxaA family hydrolase [Deltaproteobacteria bacterium]
MNNHKVMAYRRENGRVGIRNHVLILPLDDLSNSASEKVAFSVKGCKAIPHAYGRLQFGEDLELFFRTLIGTGANPNVAACVVIGIEPQWTNLIVEGIAKTGKPVAGFSIERHGEFKTVEMASWKAKEYMHWASELKREACDLNEIWVSTKCGESDTTSGLASNPTVGNAFDKLDAIGATLSFGETSEVTGAELEIKKRAATPEAAEKFMATFEKYQAMIERNKTDDLSGSQPTKGNIAGGLTTIEEKAFGNMQKIGKQCKYVGVLDKAETPTGPGLWYMDTSSAAAEAVTLWAAGGFVAHFFPTGQGNIIGNPIEPVIKLTANPRTAGDMSEHIDYDCSAILRGEMTLDESGDNLLDMLVRTCNGRLTANEVLGHEEFVLTKLYESA